MEPRVVGVTSRLRFQHDSGRIEVDSRLLWMNPVLVSPGLVEEISHRVAAERLDRHLGHGRAQQFPTQRQSSRPKPPHVQAWGDLFDACFGEGLADDSGCRESIPAPEQIEHALPSVRSCLIRRDLYRPVEVGLRLRVGPHEHLREPFVHEIGHGERVQFNRFLAFRQRLRPFALTAANGREAGVYASVARLELAGGLELCESVVVVQVPVVVIEAEGQVPFGQIGLKPECPVGSFLLLREPLLGAVEVEPVQTVIGERELGKGEGKGRVQFDGPFETFLPPPAGRARQRPGSSTRCPEDRNRRRRGS